MTSFLALTVAVLISAGSDEPPARPRERDPAVVCALERKGCDDTCTFDFGTSADLRRELGRCLGRCEERQELCLLRFFAKAKKGEELRDGGLPFEPPYLSVPSKKPSREIKVEEQPAPVRRRATRATDLEERPPKVDAGGADAGNPD